LESHEFPHDPACRHEGALTFSHGGQELAMVCAHNTSSWEYLVTDLQGKSRREVATLPDQLTMPVWSGDDRFLIVAVANAGGYEFAELPVRGGEVRTSSAPTGEWPAVSLDGHKLAISVSDNHINIWRKDLRHPEIPAVQVYTSTREQNNAQYSPDGKHVAFASARSGPGAFGWQTPTAATWYRFRKMDTPGIPAGHPIREKLRSTWKSLAVR
jgi:Tol biopolymer transport system component